MRHAKSDWADAGLSDHDRPLNARGRRDAPEMAKWLEANDFVPSLVLASTARRVHETIDRLLEQWNRDIQIIRLGTLYLASPQTILEHVRCEAIDENGLRPSRLLIVGHNPGMEQLVSRLAGFGITMPTAAVAIFECDGIKPEDEDAPRVRRLISLGRPKDLA